VIEDRARRRGERLRELRFPGARRSVEEQPLRRLDAPLPVEVGRAERERESFEDGLRLPEPADVVEGDRRLDLRLDAAGQVAVLLPQLDEDVLESPLERPLFSFRSDSAMASDRRRRSGAVAPAFSKTRSSTSTGTFARIASAIASDGARRAGTRARPR
jgi:hypothetical protein